MNKIQISTDGISTTRLPLGFQGENVHTQVIIYWSTLYSQYPSAIASMTIKPPAGEAYPKAVTQDENKVVWDVTSADVSSYGNGEYQLTFTNGTEIIKTYIGSFSVLPSLNGTGETPDPVADWIEEANAALAGIEAWDNASASAETLSPGSTATVEVGIVSGHKNFAFGIPKGDSGELVLETVTGSTPSITGVANHRYLCGTVSTISITPPASGIIDVVFKCGTTPAVLTIPNTVSFPEWFDPTSLEASVTYEINIADGMGVVAVW